MTVVYNTLMIMCTPVASCAGPVSGMILPYPVVLCTTIEKNKNSAHISTKVHQQQKWRSTMELHWNSLLCRYNVSEGSKKDAEFDPSCDIHGAHICTPVKTKHTYITSGLPQHGRCEYNTTSNANKVSVDTHRMSRSADTYCSRSQQIPTRWKCRIGPER